MDYHALFALTTYCLLRTAHYLLLPNGLARSLRTYCTLLTTCYLLLTTYYLLLTTYY